MIDHLLAQAIRAPKTLTHAQIVSLLSCDQTDALFTAAYRVKCETLGKRVHLRGLVEQGNACSKDCYYCGIRKSNHTVERYALKTDDVIRMALWSYEQGYGSVVLQSGELTSEEHTQQVERILIELNQATQGKLGITLCLGEQTAETYQRWKQAGAHRYLLRMETSNPSLYARLHPADHSFDARMHCLTMLKQIGYQVGSGVMIGLPGQTLDDLANDILFFKDFDLDMIGMGPYIPHTDTPLGNGLSVDDAFRKRQLSLGLKMIAVTRLQLHDVNIAATTALQALDDEGREKGLLAGANVIMPNVTDVQYRANYQLYANKPCLDENAAKCRNCLQWRVQSIGEEITWGERGDPLHFTKKGLPTCS